MGGRSHILVVGIFFIFSFLDSLSERAATRNGAGDEAVSGPYHGVEDATISACLAFGVSEVGKVVEEVIGSHGLSAFVRYGRLVLRESSLSKGEF
jgi:hypothetical protein